MASFNPIDRFESNLEEYLMVLLFSLKLESIPWIEWCEIELPVVDSFAVLFKKYNFHS